MVGENNGAVSKKTGHVESTWKGQTKRWQKMRQESDARSAIRPVSVEGFMTEFFQECLVSFIDE